MFPLLFYDEAGVKHVPTNIDKLLTPVELAYWFADGNFHKASKGFYLCTNAFTLAEIELLVKLLKTNFIKTKESMHLVTNDDN